MAQGQHLLTARFVETVKKDGKYRDGGGLMLRVRTTGSQVQRLWMFRYQRGERGAFSEVTFSLGTARDINLGAARRLAAECREALARGEDPKPKVKREKASKTSFGAVADQLVEDIAPGFKSEITVRNWKRTLGDDYCRAIRSKPVGEVTTDDIVALLKPIWQLKPETATKVRERIERVLDAARVRGLREGENPARWKGHLKLIMPPQTAEKGHFRALPWKELPAFMARLAARDSVSARALEWTILTVARTAMTIGCPWTEIDRSEMVWAVPKGRMKEKREHRVPLVPRCATILDKMSGYSHEWVFPARDPKNQLSNMAMSECLREFDVDATVHGFRSTFSDWAHDATEFDSELIEQALAHITGNEVKLAYRRGDALDRRRALMEAWTSYCFSAVPKASLVAA